MTDILTKTLETASLESTLRDSSLDSVTEEISKALPPCDGQDRASDRQSTGTGEQKITTDNDNGSVSSEMLENTCDHQKRNDDQNSEDNTSETSEMELAREKCKMNETYEEKVAKFVEVNTETRETVLENERKNEILVKSKDESETLGNEEMSEAHLETDEGNELEMETDTRSIPDISQIRSKSPELLTSRKRKVFEMKETKLRHICWPENDLWNENVEDDSDNSGLSNWSDEFEKVEEGYNKVDRHKGYQKLNSKINLHAGKGSLLKFAEILYKCTLCTTIPCILTSERNFLEHVRKEHLLKASHCHGCNSCSLKFRTEEDLREHLIFCHTGSAENMSYDFPGSDIRVSHDSNNDSDSDSSGHRQLRTKIPKRSKPVQDFESPKQLVDHTGIQTPDGSLDLTKKSHGGGMKIKEEKEKYLESRKEDSGLDIKQITDQIIKSDVQCRNVANNSTTTFPFVPGYTAEFGKYTKLVREGGNIVYFCQICNWKSPIKTTFQVHCNMQAHKQKVSAAENPNENCDSRGCSPKQLTKPQDIKVKAENERETSRTEKHLSGDFSFGPRMPDPKLFYSFIMRPRGTTHSHGKTPVVSPFGTGNFIEDAGFTYKRPSEHSVDFVAKRRKKASIYLKSGADSDSDSDNGRRGNHYASLKKGHYPASNLHRKRMLGENLNSSMKKSSGCEFGHNYKQRQEYQMSPTDLSLKSKNCSPNNNWSQSYVKSSIRNCYEDEKVKKENQEQIRNGTLSPDSYYKRTNLNNNKGRQCELSPRNRYRCYACPFEYVEVEEYEKHFERVHKSALGAHFDIPVWGQIWGESGDAYRFSPDADLSKDGKVDARGSKPGETSANSEMGENWRVQKLKELLPEYVVEYERGNTSRDYLLQCISNSSGMQDAVMWSSACNRAMRELFPNSQAQRKGKYKKTYYFGVTMLEGYQTPEDLTGLEGETTPAQPLRDINIDMDKIVEHLPKILRWTGNMDCGVHRQDLLLVLSDTIQDVDVGNWGAQCNRAIRAVFPNVDMKRKGKFKTTRYLGVEFQLEACKKLQKYVNSVETLPSENSRRSPVHTSVELLSPTEAQSLQSFMKTDPTFVDLKMSPSYWDKRLLPPENVSGKDQNSVRSKESKKSKTLERILKECNSAKIRVTGRETTLENLLKQGDNCIQNSVNDVLSRISPKSFDNSQLSKSGTEAWSSFKFTQKEKQVDSKHNSPRETNESSPVEFSDDTNSVCLVKATTKETKIDNGAEGDDEESCDTGRIGL